ncbi:MAG: DUF58 domain-containing protein [Pseudomonadota bacterium]
MLNGTRGATQRQSRQELLGLRQEAERVSSRLPGLLVEADRVAMTVSQGVHGRRRTGVGETFWQFRYYQAGDAASDIDWRQSARSRHLFVREQEWEAAESVWIWCDLSRSMAYTSSRDATTKRDRAVILALGLANLLIRGGERIALFGSGERARGGRHGLNTFAEHLTANITADTNAAEHRSLPQEHDLPRSARLVLISDFLVEQEQLAKSLAEFSARSASGCLLQIADPAEESFPFDGRVLFEGLEAEPTFLVNRSRSLRDGYRNLYQAHRRAISDLASRSGWRISHHRTDLSAEQGLLTLYQMLAPRAAA